MHIPTNEPLYFRPYVPGKVVVSVRWFVVLCILAALGALALLFIVFQ